MMKQRARMAVMALMVAGMAPFAAAAAARAQPVAMDGDSLRPQIAFDIAADCRQAARDTVSRTGGELLSAVPAMEDGNPVCRITVLVGKKAGERPKKVTVTVPLS